MGGSPKLRPEQEEGQASLSPEEGLGPTSPRGGTRCRARGSGQRWRGWCCRCGSSWRSWMQQQDRWGPAAPFPSSSCCLPPGAPGSPGIRLVEPPTLRSVGLGAWRQELRKWPTSSAQRNPEVSLSLLPWASGPAPSSPAPHLTPQLSEQKSAEALSTSAFPVCHPFSPSAWKDLPLHPGCWYLRGRCLLSATLHCAFLRPPHYTLTAPS